MGSTLQAWNLTNNIYWIGYFYDNNTISISCRMEHFRFEEISFLSSLIAIIIRNMYYLYSVGDDIIESIDYIANSNQIFSIDNLLLRNFSYRYINNNYGYTREKTCKIEILNNHYKIREYENGFGHFIFKQNDTDRCEAIFIISMIKYTVDHYSNNEKFIKCLRVILNHCINAFQSGSLYRETNRLMLNDKIINAFVSSSIIYAKMTHLL